MFCVQQQKIRKVLSTFASDFNRSRMCRSPQSTQWTTGTYHTWHHFWFIRSSSVDVMGSTLRKNGDTPTAVVVERAYSVRTRSGYSWTQFDASRRGKKVLNPSRDKNARHVPYWGGGRRAYFILRSKKLKNAAVSTTVWMVETQLCKLRGAIWFLAYLWDDWKRRTRRAKIILCTLLSNCVN